MEKITKSSDKVLIDPNEPLILPDGTALVGRVEWFLYALCCLDYQNLPTPMSRIEEFANALITGEVPNIEPQSRAEQFFLAILDGNVSNLPQPQSRSEILLDKLARGEFDLSDVEPIQSRYELLLAYLIKNGGIGNIDYVLYEFSEAMKTMYNTVEKPFKSLELSGNTLVNCVLEDTENDDYTSFDKDYSGTSFTINGTSEGAIKSAILKGQTLVNLTPKFTDSRWIKNGGGAPSLTKTDDYMILSPTITGSSVIELRDVSMFKKDTVYTFIVNVLENTYSKVFFTDFSLDNNTQLQVGINKFTQIFNHTSPMIRIGYTGNIDVGSVLKIANIVAIEGDYTEEDIPYFEGMQSVKMPVLSTVGKNLFQVTFEQGSIYSVEGKPVHSTTRARSIDFIKLTKGNTYTFSVDSSQENSNIMFREFLTYSTNDYNSFKVGNLGTYKKQFTYTPTEDEYIKFVLINNTTPEGVVDINEVKIQIEYGTQATTYEPYKSNILTVNEEVELRGIDEVQDTLDLKTGEVTERIGEVVLDGSQRGWSIHPKSNETYTIFYGVNVNDFDDAKQITAPVSTDMVWISNKFTNLGNWSVIQDYEQEYLTFHTTKPLIKLKNTSLSEISANGLNTYLSQNPVRVRYQLATESVKTVDLNVVDQNNNKIDKIHVFDEVTHVNASSDELTPTVNISKSVSYPTVIKPNTKYTVDLKRNDKPLTVNLGGTEVTFVDGETRKTITTPSTLTNDKLSYYGVGAKCNEIMLIEGEIERNIDYFTGMQSVVMQNQMPILHTVGKNLFDKMSLGLGGNSYTNTIEYLPELRNNTRATLSKGKLIKVKPNSTVTLSCDNRFKCVIQEYDENENRTKSSDKGWQQSGHHTLTVGEKTSKINIYFTKQDPYSSEGITNEELSLLKDSVQVEISSSKTTYESYKTSILSCNEDVTLCGIGNVKDELDCKTGEVTQRVGKLVLDGSSDEDWRISFGGSDTHTRFIMRRGSNLKPINNVNNQRFLCDKFKCVILISGENSDEVCLMESLDNFFVSIIIDNTRLNSVDVDGFKLWLQSNPIVVQYQLATPTIKTVDLFVVDQDGNTIPKVKSHNGTTHLEVTVPKQSLLPNISAEVATDNSKDMSSLTTKHQEISEAQSAIQNSIQSQSNEIDTAMMATTEIFESILE